ncbi:hypothetical protein ES692_16780 [Psychroserpens burtonensis]|uniref:Uncharacterized protein n=1 Tax=Psychroserpens burtonensis TaxID=49278 RepID=A0A5C7B386_9FLAO|nr:hypothetical protein ES692_16780 [Psychroserpens burtonensis]
MPKLIVLQLLLLLMLILLLLLLQLLPNLVKIKLEYGIILVKKDVLEGLEVLVLVVLVAVP